jgi:hypothetical protein
VAFDYFVIFNPNSVTPTVERIYPGKGIEFTKAWRSKQFEYGFLRSITQRHADFFKVTEDALVYTALLPACGSSRTAESRSSRSRISARRCCATTPTMPG